ncbi:MAG: ROK family transcriptional regulator [Trueperaceae bacterium]
MEKYARQNVQSVIETIRKSRSVNRRAIARETGLSAPTVTRIISDLLAAGVVRASDGEATGKSGPGRPAGLVSLEPNLGFIVGVDVGEHTIRVALGDLTGRIVATRRVPSVAREGGHLTFQNLIGAIEDALAEANGSRHEDASPILGITVGVPGTVDRESEIVLDAPNIRRWRNYPLNQLLQERYPRASVRVENDVNMAAVGEAAFGVGRDYRDFVFVSFRQGIGAGIWLNGELYRGGTGMAGELGFMAFDPAFDYSQSAGLGYLETLFGEQALLERAGATAVAADEQDGKSDPSLRDLCLAAKAGNVQAGEVLDHALLTYGTAISNIVSLLSPELIVLGGDLTVVGDLAVNRISETVDRLTPHRPRIMASLLGEDAGLQGAIHQAQVDTCALLFLDDEVHRSTLVGSERNGPVTGDRKRAAERSER